MMGDVSSGSATVSMVRQVLKWQKDQPEYALRVMNAVHCHNTEVERGFAKICELESSPSTPIDWEAMAAQKRHQVDRLMVPYLSASYALIYLPPC